MKYTLVLFFSFIMTTAFAATALKPVDADDAVSFTIKNFGLNTNGTLKGLKGSIAWDAANPGAGSFAVSVDVNTINTGVDSRDNHLRKEEYFNVAKYPTLSFSSTSITGTGNGTFNASGTLVLKGVSKTVVIPFTVKPSGKGFLFEGEFAIDRRDYGVGGGSMVLGNEVKIKLKVQANP